MNCQTNNREWWIWNWPLMFLYVFVYSLMANVKSIGAPTCRCPPLSFKEPIWSSNRDVGAVEDGIPEAWEDKAPRNFENCRICWFCWHPKSQEKKYFTSSDPCSDIIRTFWHIIWYHLTYHAPNTLEKTLHSTPQVVLLSVSKEVVPYFDIPCAWIWRGQGREENSDDI